MSEKYELNEWKIIESSFDPALNRSSESIFSIGNGRMGQRANFEEDYSGDTLRGSYVAGVYYPDKTRVGWWKNGYPEYFAKVLNATNWIGIRVKIDDEKLDLAKCRITKFSRILDMKEGSLSRSAEAVMPSGRKIAIKSVRFISMSNTESAAIKYSISTDTPATVVLSPYLDADVENEDSNYGEKFWDEGSKAIDGDNGVIVAITKKTAFRVATAMRSALDINGKKITPSVRTTIRDKYVSCSYEFSLSKGEEAVLCKYVSLLTSENHPTEELEKRAQTIAAEALKTGFDKMFRNHTRVWDSIWAKSDIVIEGDLAAQQGIRFNIFHLYQTYTGEDPRLNIGPKGFTGEKYGGSTYWDTEAFVFPFYLSTADIQVARNLLLYRYKHLPKAIENAEKLGFKDGAALYPMVTMNGEECHNEWEITFEEIHRNGAIAYAIYNYTRHTGDDTYLADYGLEVLIAISRFWSQRINYSDARRKYVMLGVTGPNEYENNVNNNWYTNKIAVWTLNYTIASIESVAATNRAKLEIVMKKTGFSMSETKRWKEICTKMHFPYEERLDVFLQQDGYMDKEQLTATELDPSERPINQHWSWDRILRSCFIKQADVLQGIYFFEDEFDTDTIKRNFYFYEPRTLHESSLSASIHSVLASRIDDIGKAYDLYLRTARLDLDDYNREVREGLHITSMAGSWLAIVEGFGGVRIRNSKLFMKPVIPPSWRSYTFMVRVLNNPVKVFVSEKETKVTNLSDAMVTVSVGGEEFKIKGGSTVKIA